MAKATKLPTKPSLEDLTFLVGWLVGALEKIIYLYVSNKAVNIRMEIIEGGPEFLKQMGFCFLYIPSYL